MYSKQPLILNRKFYSILLFIACVFIQTTYAQNHPGTGYGAGGSRCGSCVPAGWTLDQGSPDISDAGGWGFDNSTWKTPIPPVPNGETSWLSAHSYEIASMQITGLTVGTSYTLVFYYMSTPNNTFVGYGNFSPAVRYSINGQPMVTKTIAAEATWYREDVVFTATATTSTFTYYGGDRQSTVAPGTGELSNISFAPNGTVPTVPACPTINLTAPFSVSICNGQTATITATGPNEPNYTYSWLPGGATGKTINVTPNDTTVYQVMADSSGCRKTANTAVVVVPNPTVTATSATICPGQTATLTASGAAAYTWSPATNLSATTGSSVNSTPPGNITYTVTGTTDGCSGTAVSSVTIAGSIPISVNSETICTGETATLTASGGTTYSWSDATAANPKTVTPGSTTSYTVTGTTNGCSGTAVATVTISAALSITVNSTSICAGQSAALTASGATTYVWAEDGSSANPNTFSPVTTTSYTVTGTSNGCTGVGVGTINIIPKDDAGFSYTPSTVCKTGGSDPSPVISGTTGGTFSCPDGALVLNSSTGVITLASTPIGTYTVTYTTAGTCPDSKTFIVAIVNVPSATFSYAGPYCQNATDPLPTFPLGSSAGVFSSTAGLVFVSSGTGEVDLSASTPNAYTVTNTIAAGGGCPAATATNTITIDAVPQTTVTNTVVCSGVSTTLTAGGATTYLWSDNSTQNTLTVANPTTTTPYTVVGTTNGCSSSATGIITVNAVPTVTVDNKTVCAGTSATLTASGATSYSWSGGSTAGSLTDTPATTTSYTVTGTTAACSSSAVGTITVNAMPTVTVNSPAICAGQPATLTAAGATTYVWSDATTANPKTVSPGTTTSYTVVGTTSNCSGTAVSTVTVNQIPLVTVNSPTICVGASTTLTASGGSTYVWSNGGAGTSITVSPASTTSYTVSDNTAGCSGSAVSTVTVNTPPTVTVNSAIICVGQPATLTASGASAYQWSTGSVANALTVSPVTTTSYTVIGNPGGCSGSATTSITVMPLPVVTVTSASVCAGSPATLTAGGATSYVWSTGAVTNTMTASPMTTTNYTVTGTGGGCTNTAVGTVDAFPIPIAGFSSAPDPVGVLNPVITFTDRSSSDVNAWSWTFGDGDSLSGTPNPVHTYPSVETTYTVTLSVLNAGLCADTITHTVVVGPEFSFYIPNAFSPNEDEKNEVFGGFGTGINKYKLLIFDRWGNQIFKTEDLNEAWDGKANGGSTIVQEDVYVWKVNITDVFKKEHEYLGTVTIVK